MDLRAYLTEEKLTPAAFATTVGVTTQAMYRYLSGERMPRPAIMRKIAEVTGGKVAPADFYGAEQVAA